MEVDGQGSDPEPENPDDLSDLEELPGETNDNSDDTRQAVLLSGVTPVLEPRLEIARAAMQPTVYLDTRAGNCVDANRIASPMLPTLSAGPSTKCGLVPSSG